MAVIMPVVALHAAKLEGSTGRASFFEAYGKLGLPILFVAIASMLWTCWLIWLNVAPNATANFFMNTGDFDNGNFWLILRPDPVLVAFAALGSSIVIIMYGVVILRMTLWRNSYLQLRFLPVLPIAERVFARVKINNKRSKTAMNIWRDLTGFHGHRRKQWNALLKVADLALQMFTLLRILEYGFSPKLTIGYAIVIAINAWSCAAFILNPRQHSAFTEVLIDSIFDMLFAVGAPIVLLVYANIDFKFDRKLAKLMIEVMPPGSFQRRARLIADPREVNNFLICFDAVRITTWIGLVVLITMNVSFCYRLLRVVQVYSVSRNLRQTHSKLQIQSLAASGTATVGHSQAQARVPRVLAFVFVTVGVFAVGFTHQAIAHSTRACKAYPECAAYAYRWSNQHLCPCLSFIDVVKAPKTFQEWTDPKDVTASVSALAKSGDLLVLDIINRRMRVWPDELRRCTNLRFISLLYTDVAEIPMWAASFTKLEYLTIEGKNADTDLAKMPDNLFDAMSELTTIHIGSHRYLKVLPRLDGLRNLNDLSLATLPLLDDLPDFSKLNKLQRVEFIQLTALKRLPDFHADVSLSSFAVALSRPCCNGFLEGCDFSLSACIGMNPDSCMSSDVGVKALSEETQKQFYTHRSTICTTDELLRGVPKEMFFTSITKDQVDICQGMLSRECSVDNLSAGHSICYNERFQVIHCVKSDYAIEMRRQEIRQGVGDSCDPVVEAWLGCRPSALDYLFQAAR